MLRLGGICFGVYRKVRIIFGGVAVFLVCGGSFIVFKSSKRWVFI